MKKKFIGIAAASLLAISAFGASSASAATEFGDNCTANEALEIPFTFFDISAPGNPLPVTAPSAGVITKWRVNFVPVPFTVPQTLKVLRTTGPNTVQIVGEASGSVAGGGSSFDARIPVQAGDRLGLFGQSEFGVLVCEGGGPFVIGVIEGGGGGVGSSAEFFEVTTDLRIPVTATVEPDVDNDGYGDETQDKCPQNAAFQTPCPVVTLGVSSTARKGLVNILVTSSFQAPVTVNGTVKLGKGKQAKLNGGTQIVAPGAIAKFTMLFPQNLKAKLKELLRKRFLMLSVSATAPNIVGPPTASGLNAKLRGQKKPPRKAKGKGKGKGPKPKSNG
ncbi:MAG TPA: hypothetical protein VNP96_07455 [Solirubrobacterales bacterium]|nr:hypothetical protein [Solirubrobacterales bacterium]